jgi:hypothetical protein
MFTDLFEEEEFFQLNRFDFKDIKNKPRENLFFMMLSKKLTHFDFNKRTFFNIYLFG